MQNNKANAILKRIVFSPDLNACIFDDMRNWKGSSFHSLGAHTENALSP